MDVEMPVCGGLEAVRAARAAGLKSVIVAVTGNAVASQRQECLDAGYNDVMTKPVMRDAVRAMCQAHLK
jgi:CheY-like chemotaxis protein